MKLKSLIKSGVFFGLAYLVVLLVVLVLVRSNCCQNNIIIGVLYWLILQPADLFIELQIPLPLVILQLPLVLISGVGSARLPNADMLYYVNNIIVYFLLGVFARAIFALFPLRK